MSVYLIAMKIGMPFTLWEWIITCFMSLSPARGTLDGGCSHASPTHQHQPQLPHSTAAPGYTRSKVRWQSAKNHDGTAEVAAVCKWGSYGGCVHPAVAANNQKLQLHSRGWGWLESLLSWSMASSAPDRHASGCGSNAWLSQEPQLRRHSKGNQGCCC